MHAPTPSGALRYLYYALKSNFDVNGVSSVANLGVTWRLPERARQLTRHESKPKKGALKRSASVSRTIFSRLRLSSRSLRGGRLVRARASPT